MKACRAVGGPPERVEEGGGRLLDLGRGRSQVILRAQVEDEHTRRLGGGGTVGCASSRGWRQRKQAGEEQRAGCSRVEVEQTSAQQLRVVGGGRTNHGPDARCTLRQPWWWGSRRCGGGGGGGALYAACCAARRAASRARRATSPPARRRWSDVGEIHSSIRLTRGGGAPNYVYRSSVRRQSCACGGIRS